jgi:YidC/Oxa1 family membrane protein insertase
MDQRNLILAAAVSILILMGWEMLVAPTLMPPPPAVTETAQPAAPPNVDTDGPSAPVAAPPASPSALGQPVAAPPPAEPAPQAARVKIATRTVQGSISLAGGRIDDVQLVHFRETTDPRSAAITLLTPANSPAPYYAELGWIAADTSLKLPTGSTVWTAEDPDAVLTDTTPVTLTWDNGEGLEFRRTIRPDKDYLFRVDQTVANKTGRPVTMFPYALVARTDTPELAGFFILHEGPIGVFNQTTLIERRIHRRLDRHHRQILACGGRLRSANESGGEFHLQQ